MPTENRSSNADPRDVFIRLNPLGLGEAELRKDRTGFEDQRTHSDYLLFLAGYRETHAEPQANPEPIAWMVGTAFWWTKEEAERDAAAMNLPVIGLGPMTGAAPAEQHQGEPVAWLVNGPDHRNAYIQDPMDWAQGYEVVPLYAHADPGEVGRLRGIIRMHEKTVQEQADHLAYMRAQLAERDSLLDGLDEAWNSHGGKERFGELMKQVESLSHQTRDGEKP